MPTEKEYVIRLSGFDLGQLLDDLEARAVAWRNTATYLTTGQVRTGKDAVDAVLLTEETFQEATVASSWKYVIQ